MDRRHLFDLPFQSGARVLRRAGQARSSTNAEGVPRFPIRVRLVGTQGQNI